MAGISGSQRDVTNGCRAFAATQWLRPRRRDGRAPQSFQRDLSRGEVPPCGTKTEAKRRRTTCSNNPAGRAESRNAGEGGRRARSRIAGLLTDLDSLAHGVFTL